MVLPKPMHLHRSCVARCPASCTISSVRASDATGTDPAIKFTKQVHSSPLPRGCRAEGRLTQRPPPAGNGSSGEGTQQCRAQHSVRSCPLPQQCRRCCACSPTCGKSAQIRPTAGERRQQKQTKANKPAPPHGAAHLVHCERRILHAMPARAGGSQSRELTRSDGMIRIPKELIPSLVAPAARPLQQQIPTSSCGTRQSSVPLTHPGWGLCSNLFFQPARLAL